MSAPEILGEEPCSRGSVLVQDTMQAPGSFIIPLVLKHALRQDDRVVFVAAAQSRSHYKQVMRKLGVDLDSSVADGQLEVVPFISDYPAGLAGEGGVCEALYARVAQCITRTWTASSNRPGDGLLTLIIDDISIIAGLAGASSTHHVCRIVQSARGLCSALKAPSRFVCLARSLGDSEDASWVSHLAAAADVIVRTDHLGGASDDVHGQVSVLQKRAWGPAGPGGAPACAPGRSSFFFRLADGSVRFWADVE